MWLMARQSNWKCKIAEWKEHYSAKKPTVHFIYTQQQQQQQNIDFILNFTSHLK